MAELDRQHQTIIALIIEFNGGEVGLSPEKVNGNPDRLAGYVTSHFRTRKTLWSASTSNTRKRA